MGENILQLIATIIIFVLILVATYYATKWIAGSGALQARTKNIKVLETFKIGPNKYIQIVQLGSKYYAIGISKDNITFLTSLEEDQLDLTPPEINRDISFKDVISKAISGVNKENK
ncbi:flagellar biosynthetic protein FliO [Eubacterium xylanophilum]|uniref:flagellar biosynthetic protein FliO n=1 Tax=Eubacterium xylanophilum TaxID=39497 RepID=UPI00047A7412|nr:flagellar biosynthetic protein FliO [Eubacterium xylanophilum]